MRPPAQNPPPGNPARRFIASMTMTFDMWHDGAGYDLDALKKLSGTDLQKVADILINHQPRDWRDIEALALIDLPQARKEVEKALQSSDTHVRQVAQRSLPVKVDPADRERLLVKSLTQDALLGGLGATIDEIPDFHPPAVIDALFRGLLKRDGEIAVHFAALLMFLHGKAKEPFDWSLRPFFLRFNTADRAQRQALFRELCAQIHVDPAKYLRGSA